MIDKEGKRYSTIDHSNKLGEGRRFDPYQYWLKQAKRREEIDGQAKQNDVDTKITRRKSRLT